MKYLILSLIIFISSATSFADHTKTDPFNTYQWKKQKLDNIKNKDWFEWWYYKIVLPKTNKAYYFVYGIVNPADVNHIKKSTRSYVGIGDFANNINFDYTYPMTEFSASDQLVSVQLPDANATDHRIQGNITNSAGKEYRWDIDIEKKWNINAEGWLMGTGLSNIDWYPAQADATCSGQIIADGELVKFSNAPCYQDRNWGVSFPEWWTWIVANHFEDHPESALVVGGGRPRILDQRSPKASVIVGLKHKGKEYSFNPTQFDRVDIDIRFGKWEVIAIGHKQTIKIEISAYAPASAFMDLQFMMPNGKIFHDYEALLGQVKVNLYKRSNIFSSWELIDRLISNHAGIEYGSEKIKTLEALQRLEQSSHSPR